MNNDTNKSTEPKKPGRRYWTAGIIAVLSLTTVLGAQAYTGSRIAQHVNIESAFSGEHGKVWKTGWRRGGSHFGSMSAEEREKQIVRMVKHLAVEIDATSEQQTKLVTLIKSVAEDMLPMKAKMHESREQALKLLTATTIDREAIETMRLAKLAEADTISKNLVTAVADAAEILTPEQRKTVAERIETFRKMRGHRKH
jgi:protein CpxP